MAASSSSSSAILAAKTTPVEWGPLRFLIMDSPKDSNLHLYLKECKKHNVTHIVRISEPSYSKDEAEKAGITIHEMFYEDGQSPPPEVLSRWLELVGKTFDAVGAKDVKPCIAIHCVAGLGRAPVLVAIALVEYGLDAGSAVSFIRERRRGAINAVQLSYLQGYKKQKRGTGKCLIS